MTEHSKVANPNLTDPTLRPFLSPEFSSIDYLNLTLPSLSTTKQQPATSLSAIASQTQLQVSALNAQTSRLSTTLTSLTDEILRTSSRLAYEVELLRGEALSLADSLSSRGDLNEFIRRFVPDGLDASTRQPEAPTSPLNKTHNSKGLLLPQAPSVQSQLHLQDQNLQASTGEPEALPRLRTLLHVRAQLQTVIQCFNLALSFPFPPSLLTTTASSLISVNPPNQDPNLESKGQSALSRFKQEVMDLQADADGRGSGIERARERIAELRDLCIIWKGTGEERARLKWIESLEQMVNDEFRKKEEGNMKSGAPRSEGKRDNSTVRNTADAGGSGPGFLRRLRDEIYME